MANPETPYSHNSHEDQDIPGAADEQWPTWPKREVADTKMDRRLFVSAVGAAAVTAMVGAAGATRLLRKSPEAEPLAPSVAFEDAYAEAVAGRLGLTTTELVRPDYRLDARFAAFKGDQLYPIFHPKVYDHKELLYTLAEANDIPVNYLAFIASVESGGNPDAGSGKGAVGLFQLMPQYYLEGVVDESKWHDPEATGQIAADYIKQCLNGARALSDQRGENLPYRHPDLFILAAGMYNAGINGASADYAKLPVETQQYMQHARRFMQVAELANGLREEGQDDKAIVEALQSRSVDERASAFKRGRDSYNATEALEYLSGNPMHKPANSMEKALYENYDAALRRKDGFPEQPLNPFLAIHTATADGFISGIPENRDPRNYLAINTSR